MQLGEKQLGDVLVISPREERLDAAAAGEFKVQMLGFIEQGHAKLVINLGQVNFMDSSGLTAIVTALKSLGKRGGQLAVSNVSDSLQALFRMTRLDQVFKVYASEQEACGALSGGPEE
jgi:anti-sigma B factor antagonist